MAQDFDELFFDFENMSDDEIYDVVVQHLQEYPNVDAGWIEVRVQEGHVNLSGRVGTDSEKQVAEKVVAEVLGIRDYSNELVVSELVRGQLPEAADLAAAIDQDVDEQTGEPDMSQSDTAEHLVQDLTTQTYGTHDMQEAIEEGAPYVPPDRPIADGYGSEEQH